MHTPPPNPTVSYTFDFLEKFTEETWHGSSHRIPLNVSSLLCCIPQIWGQIPEELTTSHGLFILAMQPHIWCRTSKHPTFPSWKSATIYRKCEQKVQILNQVFKLALEAIKRVCYNGPCHWYYKMSVWKTVFFFLHSLFLPLQCYRKCYFNKTKKTIII